MRIELKFTVTAVQVVSIDGADSVILTTTERPTIVGDDHRMCLEFSVAAGHGIQYVFDNFDNIDCLELIDRRGSRTVHRHQRYEVDLHTHKLIG